MIGAGLDALNVDLGALVMPELEGVPTKTAGHAFWPWAAGAVGAGLAGWGAHELLSSNPAEAAPLATHEAAPPATHEAAPPATHEALPPPPEPAPVAHALSGYPPVHSGHAADIVNQYAQRDDRLKGLIVDQLDAHPSHDWRMADRSDFEPLVKEKAPFYVPDPVGRFRTATDGLFKALEAANPAEEADAFAVMRQHRAGIQ